jgi:glycolate oxidase FAD binding subunit
VRDFVLGTRILDGNGRDLKFGGRVMKNVAGYDVSRLMCGSLGTLGVLLEVSLKVLPLPEAELTLEWQINEEAAIEKMNQWMGECLPISATYYFDRCLRLRFSGNTKALQSIHKKLGGMVIDSADDFWLRLKEHALNFFQTKESLWRLSIKSTTPPLDLNGPQLIEWGGALRWIVTSLDSQTIREQAAAAGGHATLFRANDKSSDVFQTLSPALLAIHRRLKNNFDPMGIFNINRMYADF